MYTHIQYVKLQTLKYKIYYTPRINVFSFILSAKFRQKLKTKARFYEARKNDDEIRRHHLKHRRVRFSGILNKSNDSSLQFNGKAPISISGKVYENNVQRKRRVIG